MTRFRHSLVCCMKHQASPDPAAVLLACLYLLTGSSSHSADLRGDAGAQVLTPFLPGDSLLFAAGAFAALGSLHLPSLMGIFMTAAILGDAVNYAAGHYLGELLAAVILIPTLTSTLTLILSLIVTLTRTLIPSLGSNLNLNLNLNPNPNLKPQP